MIEVVTLLLAGIGGLMMGAVFFGGLWWTVRKGVASPNPALWFIGSLILRMSLVLPGFYLISRHGNWQMLVSCLLGFIAARIAVLRLTLNSGPPGNNLPEPRVTTFGETRLHDPDAKESHYAS